MDDNNNFSESIEKKYNYFLAIDLKNHQLGENVKTIDKNSSKLIDDNFRWTKDNNLHVTIFYFGPLNLSELKLLKTNLNKLLSDTSKFNIKISGYDIFSKRKNSPIVMLINSDNNQLLNIYAEIKEKIKKIFPNTIDCSTLREYKPHLTIGKYKGKISNKIKSIIKNQFSTIDLQNQYLINKIQLMHLNPDSQCYETDLEFELK